jgi:hypothetical protein
VSDVEVFIDPRDGWERNFLSVHVGRRTREGLFVERIEPVAIEDEGYDEVEGRRRTRVSWANCQRILNPGVRAWDGTQETDPVSYRIHRDHVRDLALALLAFADGDKGGPPGDASALRRDLDAERFEHAKTRERMADLTDVIARIAEREPLVLDPVIVEPVVHVVPGDAGYGITVSGPSPADVTASLTDRLKD